MLGQWELVCDRAWIKAMMQSVYYAGIFVGSLIAGYLADRFPTSPALWLYHALGEGPVEGGAEAGVHGQLHPPIRRLHARGPLPQRLVLPHPPGHPGSNSLSYCLAIRRLGWWAEGGLEAGVWQTAFVIGIELVGPSKRLLAGLVIEYFFRFRFLLLQVRPWDLTGPGL